MDERLKVGNRDHYVEKTVVKSLKNMKLDKYVKNGRYRHTYVSDK